MDITTADHLAYNVDAAKDLAEALDELDTLADIEELTDETREVLTDHGIEDLDELDPGELFEELLDVAALEIYGTARIDADTINVTGIVVVTGTGGPHIEFEVSHTGGVEIRGYWSQDRVTRWTRVDFGDRLAEWIGGWDQDR